MKQNQQRVNDRWEPAPLKQRPGAQLLGPVDQWLGSARCWAIEGSCRCLPQGVPVPVWRERRQQRVSHRQLQKQLGIEQDAGYVWSLQLGIRHKWRSGLLGIACASIGRKVRKLAD